METVVIKMIMTLFLSCWY